VIAKTTQEIVRRVLLVSILSIGIINCTQTVTAEEAVPVVPTPAIQNPDTRTAVEKYGSLKVQGNQMVGSKGEAVQLRGMSLFWSQWMGQYYNAETVKWLIDDWKINVIRASMAVDKGGYATNPLEVEKVYTVIDAAIANGIYVIVDFHVHDGNKYLKEAQTFFSDISKRYGDKPHLIYEPWNEPVDDSWSQAIKPYHEAVINVIRKNDPDNLIVCGNRRWSQEVDEASLNPIKDSNVAYTLHFYAGTHRDDLRAKAERALKNGVAIMVTEYGTCEATGDGNVDQAEVAKWYAFMDKYKISHCNWSVANKDESASIVKPDVKTLSGWTNEQLTISGKIVKGEVSSKNK
jgi:endoglucanase